MSKKLTIKEALSLCGYNNNIKKQFILFLQSNYCNQKNKLYLFERNEKVPKLFLLLLKIPSKYKNETYDISVLIYFPLNFPLIPPEIYFHKYCSVKINPNCLNYIDEETLKIKYEIFFKWENSFESFKNLINAVYKQFNNNFPIFTFENQYEKNNNDGDCVLREQCCKEIEISKPLINNRNNQHYSKEPISHTDNNKININDSPNLGIINIHRKEKVSGDEKNKALTERKKRVNNNANVNNNNDLNSKNFNTNNNNNDIEPFDEEKEKIKIIRVLISQLYPKINKINISMEKTKNNLEDIKNSLTNEINDLDQIEKQKENIGKSINLVKKELNSFNNTVKSNKNFDIKNINFSNLDSILLIKNKKFYDLLSKEKTIEEYIIVLKKAYEKHLMDLKTAINLVRSYSRQIFYIKYRYRSVRKNI